MEKFKKLKFSDLLKYRGQENPTVPADVSGDNTTDHWDRFNHQLTLVVEAAAEQGIEQDEPWQYDEEENEEEKDDEEVDDVEVDEVKKMETQTLLNPPHFFLDDHKIPLLRFSSDPTDTLQILNSLTQYAEDIMGMNNTPTSNFRLDKLQLYIFKIEEGLRFSKHLNGDGFFKSETLWIENKTAAIKATLQEHKKGLNKRSFWG